MSFIEDNEMIVEVGEFYKTRDGRKVGPMKIWGSATDADTGDVLFDTMAEGFTSYCWRKSGENGDSQVEGFDYLDLVALWQEPTSQGPVRTKTVKEVVPGNYGIVFVRKLSRGAEIGIQGHFHTATELRAAAATLLEIAEALEE